MIYVCYIILSFRMQQKDRYITVYVHGVYTILTHFKLSKVHFIKRKLIVKNMIR